MLVDGLAEQTLFRVALRVLDETCCFECSPFAIKFRAQLEGLRRRGSHFEICLRKVLKFRRERDVELKLAEHRSKVRQLSPILHALDQFYNGLDPARVARLTRKIWESVDLLLRQIFRVRDSHSRQALSCLAQNLLDPCPES